MSPDPIGLKSARLASPKTLNLYSYVQGDPINFKDPTGTDFWSTDWFQVWDYLCNVGFELFCSKIPQTKAGNSKAGAGIGGGSAGADGRGGGIGIEFPPRERKSITCTIDFFVRGIESLFGLPIPGAKHGYLVFTDAEGIYHVFEGKNEDGRLVAVDSFNGPYRQLKADHQNKDENVGSRSGADVCSWLPILEDDAYSINFVPPIKYNLFGPNSSSVLRYMVKSLPDQSWYHKPFMVGWGSLLPGVEI